MSNILDKKNDGQSELEKYSGSVNSVIYSNEENGYLVFEFSTDDDDLMTATGILPYVGEGDSLTIWGSWKHNPRYGKQFSVEQYERYMPQNASAILRYLSSGAIKGIGKKTAQRIVDQFGDDTLDVLENHPDWLSDVNGISPKKAKEITKDFNEKAGIRSAMIFFREFFGASATIKIYKRWGSAAIDIAKANPYRLCDEVDGVGFDKADSMALRLGVSKDSSARMVSGISYVLNSHAREGGHVCLPEDVLIHEAMRVLDADENRVRDAIDDLITLRRIRMLKMDGIKYLYDRYAYENEKYISEKLTLLDSVCPSVDVGDVSLFIANEERKSGFSYDPLQKEAISGALLSGVMILTGGPGTGKTTIVKALLDIFRSMDMDVALAAPTGRAAKRLSETTSFEAKTIHRLLEFEFTNDEDGRSGFRRNETDHLNENVIIVDEASMIDNSLMAALLRAIKPGGRIIIIGDADQLPCVGAGNVLRDLIASEKFSSVRLNNIFRQAESSLIVTNAHKINHGELPKLDSRNGDFFFLQRKNDQEIAFTVADLYQNRLPRTYGAETKNNIQVISPSRKGESGTENLNVLLQARLNPANSSKREIKYRDTTFREGDKVMQIRNNYDIEWEKDDGQIGMGIFNGDIGTVDHVNVAAENVTVRFDDKYATYDVNMLEELEMAYAVTVHKSQGSEYPIVIIPMYSAPYMLLTRNLLYTAVTRAQNMVILVGKPEIVDIMVKNDHQSKRYTGLGYRLKHSIDG